MTLHDFKPFFQRCLRPLANRFYEQDVSPNKVTLYTMLGSIGIGLLLVLFPFKPLFILLPIALFIRMAMNAIDGMIAKEHNQQTRWGAILDELGGVVSDIALYLPFMFLPYAPKFLIMLTIFAFVITEFCGILVKSLGGKRRYDGPLGKSERAFVLGVYALLIVFFPYFTTYLWLLFVLLFWLAAYTSFTRCYKGINELEHATAEADLSPTLKTEDNTTITHVIEEETSRTDNS